MSFSCAERKQWRTLVEHLKNALPLSLPVRVLRPRCGMRGGAEINVYVDEYVITIDAALPWQPAVDALIEEHAHGLAGWRGGDKHDRLDHGAPWGLAVAAVKQAVIDWSNEP